MFGMDWRCRIAFASTPRCHPVPAPFSRLRWPLCLSGYLVTFALRRGSYIWLWINLVHLVCHVDAGRGLTWRPSGKRSKWRHRVREVGWVMMQTRNRDRCRAKGSEHVPGAVMAAAFIPIDTSRWINEWHTLIKGRTAVEVRLIVPMVQIISDRHRETRFVRASQRIWPENWWLLIVVGMPIIRVSAARSFISHEPFGPYRDSSPCLHRRVWEAT